MLCRGRHSISAFSFCCTFHLKFFPLLTSTILSHNVILSRVVQTRNRRGCSNSCKPLLDVVSTFIRYQYSFLLHKIKKSVVNGQFCYLFA